MMNLASSSAKLPALGWDSLAPWLSEMLGGVPLEDANRSRDPPILIV